MPLRAVELFSGVGTFSMALRDLGIEYELIDSVEIDPYAVKAFNAIHGTNFGPQDIAEWDKDIECDLITHGSPCQDFSVAGKQAGGDKGSGTRSSLMYETLRIVEKLRPKYVIWENVKNLLSKKHRHNFDAYLETMEKLGYKNYYQVLNAKQYGVPQNRERVFTVSILDDKIIYDDYNSSIRKDQDTIGTLTTNCGAQAPRNGWKIIEEKINFEFPEPVPLKKKLKDVLEKEVAEKYYLSSEKTSKLKFSIQDVSYCLDANYHKGTTVEQYVKKHRRQIVKVGDLDIKGQDQIKRVYSSEGISPTLSTMQGGQRQPKIIDPQGRKNKVCVPRDFAPALRAQAHGNEPVVIDDTYGYDDKPREYSDVSPTLRAGRQGLKVENKIRVRRLTPRECWRLMGYSDSDFDKAKNAGLSDSRLYKLAGNGIVLDVAKAILKELFCGKAS